MEILTHIINKIFNLLDNTFYGTFLAGSLLAFIGLEIYRKQKKVDVGFENTKRLHNSATRVFETFGIAIQRCNTLLNMYDKNEPVISSIYAEISKKYGNTFFEKKLEEENTAIEKVLTEREEELIGIIRSSEALTEQETKQLRNDIDTIRFLMNGLLIVIKKSSQEEIKEYRDAIEDKRISVENVLKKLLGNNGKSR